MVILGLDIQYVDDFYELFVELMQEGYANFPQELRDYFLQKDYSKKNFVLWHEKNFRKVFLAFNEKDEVVGFIVGDNTYGGIGFVSWLGVKKEYRKTGVGTKLLNTYEEYIKYLGAHVLELYASDDVKSFYEKYGMKEVGRREEGYFGQKNIIMDKVLGKWDKNNIILAKTNS